jgi:eukaryotic-like serine/threonine-protein kinase
MGSSCRYCGSNVEERAYCPSCQRSLESDPESLVSQTLGNHRIERLLGEGPIGAVYEAIHLPSNERVRLKILDSELLETDAELVESAGQLVVGSTGLHDSLPDLMEVALERVESRIVSVSWRDGQTLREMLEGGRLSETEACVAIGGVLKALDALHGAGLSHRDIKPGNVLIAPEGSKPLVHLLDVGPSIISSRARSGAHYRSPEQARGGERVGPAADIYACGALLYEALAGRPPFEASDYDVLMSQISLRRPPPLGELCPDIDPSLAEIVSKAMETKPGDRYRSALEMLEALRTFVTAQQRPSLPEERLSLPQAPSGGFGVPQAPPPLEDRADGGPKPPPPSAPTPKPTPASAIDPSLFELPKAPARVPTASSQAEEPPERSGSGMKIVGIIVLVVVIAVGGGLAYWLRQSAAEQEAMEARLAALSHDAGAPTKVERTKSAGTVRVRLEGVPRGGVWFVDGRQLGANPFRAPRSNQMHRIRVEAPGHEPFETEITFAEDREVTVEMTPTEPVKAIPNAIKAYQHGLRANQRPQKRERRGGGIVPIEEDPGELAPDALRKRP